jgi:hypothetical protein
MKLSFGFRNLLAALGILAFGSSFTASAQVGSLGPIGWWKADNNTFDRAGGNDGVLYSGIYTNGVFGQAFSFDPANTGWSGVTLPDRPDYALTNALTIEGWIKPQGDGYIIFWRGDNLDWTPTLCPCKATMTWPLKSVMKMAIMRGWTWRSRYTNGHMWPRPLTATPAPSTCTPTASWRRKPRRTSDPSPSCNPTCRRASALETSTMAGMIFPSSAASMKSHCSTAHYRRRKSGNSSARVPGIPMFIPINARIRIDAVGRRQICFAGDTTRMDRGFPD